MSSKFVCPDWACDDWNPNECEVMPCAGGAYAVVDHSLQVTVYTGTKEECYKFLEKHR